MSFLTIAPLLFGYPLYVWLGMVLAILLTIQISTGLYMVRHNFKYFGIHKINFILIIIVALVHMYMALGVWFFHFTIK